MTLYESHVHNIISGSVYTMVYSPPKIGFLSISVQLTLIAISASSTLLRLWWPLLCSFCMFILVCFIFILFYLHMRAYVYLFICYILNCMHFQVKMMPIFH